ncbi:MAG: signal peptidase II [Nitrospiraceae bacterium]|nr:signal peptidase II [Nitrospiraceae bacterium]
MMAWALAVILVVIDQATKTIAHRLVDARGVDRVSSFLNIVRVRNPGSAFGMLQHAGSTFFIAITAAVIVVIIYILAMSRRKQAGLVLVLAGAAGNLADRVLMGSVRDFIDFHAGRFHWPAFNFADAYITIGIVLLFISSLKKAGG